jgi:hypothetical protein
MKKAVSAAYGAVIALLVTVAHEHLFTQYLQWPPSASLTGAVAIGVVLLIAYELVGGSRVFARRFSPISKVEGAWKINVTNNKERPQSVCKIYLSQREHVYKGYGINVDGTIGSEWSSRDVHYDEEKDELSFTADATVLKTGKRVRNYGYIKFFKNADGKYDYGTGYFVDMADDLTQSHMTLTRIIEKDFDETVKEMFAKTKSLQESVAQPSVPPDCAKPPSIVV